MRIYMKLSYHQKSLLRDTILIVAIIIIGYFYFKYPFTKYLNFWWSSLAWMGGFALLAYIFSRLGWRIGNRIRGRGAELDVEDKLFDLPDSYKVLSNLVIGSRGNIDEVVIGPTGIWVIEVKSHDGIIGFDGQELTRDGARFQKDFLGQVWSQKKTIEETILINLNISLHAQPVVVFSSINAKVHFGLNKKNGVYVVGYDWLHKLIMGPSAQTSMDQKTVSIVTDALQKYQEDAQI